MGKRKLTGIANLGNTCYMNSALQCGVIACGPLAEFFLSDSFLAALSVPEQESVSKALAWLVGEIQNPDNRGAIYPSMVKSRIDAKLPRFKGTDQHDCSEFLIELLDCLHMELSKSSTPPTRSNSLSMLTRSASSLAALSGSISGRSWQAVNWRSKGEQWWLGQRKQSDSIIKRLFEGAIRSVMTCYKCGGVSARFEAFTSLILPLTASSSSQHRLGDLINELLRPEELDGIDCDFCGRKQRFHRQIDLWQLPPYLIFTISRFSFDFSARKLANFVDYPTDNLDLEAWIAKEAPLQTSTQYELYAVVEHEGTVNRGHYTALVKVDEQWMTVNDGRTANVPDLSRVVSSNAYVLFYRWKDSTMIDDAF